MSDLNQLFAPLNYNVIYDVSFNWTSIACSSNGQYVVACVYNSYVYVSSNYGLNPWTTLSDVGKWYGICMDDSGQNIVVVSSPGYIYYTNSGTKLIQSTSNPSNWQSVSGRMYSQSNVYAVESPGYIWKSTDKGKSWTRSTSNITSNWASIATDQLNHVVALEQIGTIYYSSNGLDWNKSDAPNKNWAYVTCSNSGNYFFANAANDYIYVSTNYGANWSALQFSPIQNWARITCSYDGSYVASTAFGVSLYTSSNFGQTWYKQINSIPGNWNFPICDSTGQKTYFTGNSYGLYSILTTSLTKFTTSGVDLNQMFNAYNNVWQQTNAPTSMNFVSIATSYSGSIINAIDGYTGLYSSSDYGNTWTNNYNSTGLTCVTTDSTGSIVYFAGSDGIYLYFFNITKLYNINSVKSISTNKSGTYVLAGSNGGLYLSTDSGLSFSLKISGQIQCVTMSSDGIYMYCGIQNTNINISSNSGGSFNSLTSSPQKNWQSIACSSSGQYVLAVENSTLPNGGIWKSTDYGSTWTQINTPTLTSDVTWYTVTCDQTGRYIYATTTQRITWTSADFGTTWFMYTFSNFASVACSSTSQYVYGCFYSIYKLAKRNNSNFIFSQGDLSMNYVPQTSTTTIPKTNFITNS